MNSFRHSGKLGDIIYSLPTVRALGGGHFFVDHRKEYIGKPPLGEEPALQMLELLRTQDYIMKADLYDGEPFDYDLDHFRDAAVPMHLFNGVRAETAPLAGLLFGGVFKELRDRLLPKFEIDLPLLHWVSSGLPGTPDLSEPWLKGISPKPVAEIVLNKTTRHRGSLDWGCLRDYSFRCVFVGLEKEWLAFREDCFDVKYYKATDLVDFASVIAGSKLFVGNQSFALSVADAMLSPRVAELWDPSPIRIPARNSYTSLSAGFIEDHLRKSAGMPLSSMTGSYPAQEPFSKQA